MSTVELVDDAARARISRDGLDELLFVEAGAGTGKTKQLVDRVVALVLDRAIPMREIAAITFTEAAASELRSRVREAFERRRHEMPTDDPRLAGLMNIGNGRSRIARAASRLPRYIET